ncbi:MAG: hypothetical protein ACLP5H_13310 [Desulfomonilaceae bacterium]
MEALFGQYFEQYKGFIEVQAFTPFCEKPSTRFFPNIDTLAKEHFSEEEEVFFGTCPCERMKLRMDIRYITALWAALDVGGGYSGKDAFPNCQKAARAVRNFPLAPSIIVESGRGIHLYWLLDEPMKILDVARIEKELKRISMYFKGKREVKIDTMLRLPDTFNNRITDLRVTCKIKYVNSALRYTPEDIDGCLGLLKRWGIHLTE